MNYHKRKLRREDKKEWNHCNKQCKIWGDAFVSCPDENHNELSVAVGLLNHYYMAMEYYERHIKG